MEHVDHILIVDDDREIRELLSAYLKKNGLRASIAADGRQMRAFLDANTVDLIVLDVMMPGDDGLVLCRELRAGKYKATPILMLTARNDEMDRILGLEMGADDYLAKPFAARELLARIKAVLRRTRMLPPNLQISEAGQILSFGDWRLDTVGRHLLDREGTTIALSGAEYRLLRVFIDHPQRVLNRDQLLNLTQGRDADLFDRSIDLLVSRLRQRLGDDAREPVYIKTVRSEGYEHQPAGSREGSGSCIGRGSTPDLPLFQGIARQYRRRADCRLKRKAEDRDEQDHPLPDRGRRRCGALHLRRLLDRAFAAGGGLCPGGRFTLKQAIPARDHARNPMNAIEATFPRP